MILMPGLGRLLAMSARKVKWVVLLLLCLAVAGGYLLAFNAVGDCTRDTADELRMRGVTGFNLDGTRVPADKIPLSAWVVFPFVVDVYYDVPNSLRLIRRRNRYFVLPGVTIKEPLSVGHTL
jgi:hypothetical protein